MKKFILSIFLLCIFSLALAEDDSITYSLSGWQLITDNSFKHLTSIKSNNSALLVIDFQNFNANKKGFLGELFDDKNNTIGHTQIAIAKARKAGVPIIYINTILDPEEMPDTQLFRSLKKQIDWDELSPEALQWNFSVIDALKPQPGDRIIQKGSWSNGFYNTNLTDVLHTLNIRNIIFTGVSEPIAIYGTFLGAFDEGFETIMLEDCIMASGSDIKTQNSISNFSKNIFYPMLGAKIISSRELKFVR